MEIIYILLPASLVLVLIALCSFVWAARNGQFEDLQTPAQRMLFDDPKKPPDNSDEVE